MVAILLTFLFALFVCTAIGSPQESSSFLTWEPFEVFNNINRGNPFDMQSYLKPHQRLAEDLIGQKVYVSLTTIDKRLYGIEETVRSIVDGIVLPSHIYIFVSKDPYLIDKGVDEQVLVKQFKGVLELKNVFPFISVVYTKNIGPHRKLLPLLREKWSEDCVIITIDDHEIYKPTAVAGLIQYYVASGRNSVVAMRCRRMAVCRRSVPLHLAPYFRNGRGVWPEAKSGTKEMLTLPTGIAGILYRPRFFNENVIFDPKLINITRTGDDLMFRIATMANGVSVVSACTKETVRDDDICPPNPPRNLSPNHKDSNISTFNDLVNNYRTKDIDKQGGIISILTSPGSKILRGRGLAVTAERRADPRKQVSLATKYNERGGNDVMWKQAAEYLHEKGLFDFDMVLQREFFVERLECTRNCTNCPYSMFLQWRHSTCGIVNC